MSKIKPITPGYATPGSMPLHKFSVPALPVCFTRQELQMILNVYGRHVAAGEWRDYAVDMNRDKAIFSIFRRASEIPIYRVEKNPKLARKQGAFSIITATGLILKRGSDLRRVLNAIDRRINLVGG